MFSKDRIHPSPIANASKALLLKNSFKRNVFSATTSHLEGVNYKRIYEVDRDPKNLEDFYTQIFPGNANTVLKSTIPDLYLENPRQKPPFDQATDLLGSNALRKGDKIAEERETQRKLYMKDQLQKILKRYQAFPCCRVHRDESRFVLLGHNDPIYDIQLGRSQRMLFSAGADGVIRQWDLHSKQLANAFEERKEENKESLVYSIQISRDERLIFGAKERVIVVWDVEVGKVTGRMEDGHDGPVFSIALDDEKRRLYSCSTDKKIVVWDVETFQRIGMLEGHLDIVRRIKISPDCRILVSGSDDNTAIIWDLEEQAPLTNPIQHAKSIRSLAISPNSKYLFSGSMDHSIQMWDLTNGQNRGDFPGNKSTPYVLTVNEDSETLISAGWDKIIRFWDIESKRLIRTLEGHTDTVRSIILLGSGGLISSGSDKSIRIWDISHEVEKQVLEGHIAAVKALALTPDERYLISASEDRSMKLWDLERRELVHSFNTKEGHTEAVKLLCATNQRICSASNDKRINIWGIDERKIEFGLEGHQAQINSLALSKDGKRLYSGGGDRVIFAWDLETRRRLFLLEGHENYVRTMVLSKEDNYLISGAWDKTIRIWDLRVQKQIERLNEHTDPVMVIAMSADERMMASAGLDRNIKLWDFEMREVRLTLIGHTGSIKSILISPDSKQIFSGSVDKTIRIWDSETGRQVVLLEGHSSAIYSVLLVSDSSLLISCSFDQSIRLWPIKRKETIEKLKGPSDAVRSVALSPDGAHIYTGGADTSIRIWSIRTCKQVGVIWGHNGTVFSLLVTRDSERIVSASGDQTIRVWEIEMKRQIKLFKDGHKVAVRVIAFTPGEKKIISGGEDGLVLVWDYENQKVVGKALEHEGAIHALVVTNDARKIIAGGKFGCVKIWDIGTRSCVVSLKHKAEFIFAMVLSEDSRLITGDSEKTIRFYCLDSQQELISFFAESQVRSLTLSSNGLKLLSGGEDHKIRVWDLETKKLVRVMEGHVGKIKALVASPNSEIISGSYDNTIRVWNLESGNQIGQMQSTGSFYSLSLNPDSTKIVAGRFEKAIRIWDIKTKKEGLQFERKHTDVIRAIIFTPDSNRIISCSADASIKVWDSRTSQLLFDLTGHNDTVFCLLVISNVNFARFSLSPQSPQERAAEDEIKAALVHPFSEVSQSKSLRKEKISVLISGSYDQTIKLWDLSTGLLLLTLNGHKGAVFVMLDIPDETRFLSAGADGKIRLWVLGETAPNHVFLGHKEAVRILALSPRKDLFVSGSVDKTFRIWDINRKEQVAFLRGDYSGSLRSAAFSPDGKKLVIGSFDGNFCVWDLASKTVIFKGDSKIVAQVQPFFSLWDGEGRVLGLLGHIVYDFSNETPLFTVGEFESLNEVLFSDIRKSFICVNKNDQLMLRSFQDIAEFGTCFSNIQAFFNEESKEDLDLLIKKSPILLPFYFNFLHIIALFENKKPFHFKKFDKVQVPLSYFLQLDFLDKTCLDIAIEFHLKSLISTYMQMALNSLSFPSTTFYQKMKFFAYDFNHVFKQAKKPEETIGASRSKREDNDPKNIYHFLTSLLAIFEKDTTILSSLFEASFLEMDPACFPDNYSIAELPQTVFAVIPQISDLSTKEALDRVLRPSKTSLLHFLLIHRLISRAVTWVMSLVSPKTEKITNVKCKVFLLKGLTEISSDSLRFHKTVMTFDPRNPLFSNRIFQMLIQYKWQAYAKKHLLFKCLAILSIFSIYLTNNIYILPIRSKSLGEEFGSNKYDTISLVLDIILLTYFSIYAINETFQLNRSGVYTYLSSPWNWCDMILAPLVFTSCIQDIYEITKQRSDIDSEKIIYSISLLFFWIRVLSFSRAFEGTGFMIRLLIQVILDMKYFLVMIILFNLAFSSAGFVLQKSFDLGQWDLFTLFYRLMLGDFTLYDSELTSVENDILLWVLMILFTVLLSVIMLNLLISIIGETFSKVRNAESSMKYYELYSIITEIEDAMSENEKRRLRKEGKIGNYLVCLHNENSELEKNEESFENRVMGEIKTIQRDISHLGADVEGIAKEMKEFRKVILSEIKEIKNGKFWEEKEAEFRE